jgi:exonuclease V gamma subunit
MTNDRKRKLEKLLKDNKAKQAKKQLADDFKKYHVYRV